MTDISGRVAVVTGGGSGIGRAIAFELANHGASVVVADILEENAVNVVDEIGARGGHAIAIQCDVTDRDLIRRMKERVTSELGTTSLLFANAGATSFERLDEMSEVDVDWIVHANFLGVINCLLAFYPEMVKAKGGHISATASTAGLLPTWVPQHVPYSGAKLGVVGLMLNLISEAAEHNIGVTVLCPGGVVTGMTQNNARYRPERFGGPGDGGVNFPEGFSPSASSRFRPAEEVGSMMLRAVLENHPMVITDGSMRQLFRETYVKLVEEAFDFADEFEATCR